MRRKAILFVAILTLTSLVLLGCGQDDEHSYELTSTPTPEATPMPTPEATPMPTPEVTPVPTPAEAIDENSVSAEDDDEADGEKEQGSKQNSEQSSGQEPGRSPTVPTSEANVNLRSLLIRNLSEVRHLLGSEISSSDQAMLDRLYDFDTGVRIGVVESTEDAVLFSIVMDYRQTQNLSAFHFDGIDGNSTRDDVIAVFGDGTREHIGGEQYLGAVNSVGYDLHGDYALSFFFNASGNVIAIRFALAFM